LLGPDTAITREQVSITDPRAVDELLADRRPEWVFNCAAYNAVDRAEAEADSANAVNSQGPYNLAAACTKHNARLVHFSTNFVFDGKLERPYLESDVPSPLSAYARSKLDGERRVLEVQPEALVLRTAALFGGHRGLSFPERIVQRVTEGVQLRVVSDQQVNPTYTADLARAALELAEKGERGIFHVVSDGCCSWYDFAKAILEECWLPARVEAVSTNDFAAPAQRPVNGCLKSERIRSLRHWRESLHEWAAGHEKGSLRP
jgi:dTDP-4-dehydrorhamnose reductase